MKGGLGQWMTPRRFHSWSIRALIWKLATIVVARLRPLVAMLLICTFVAPTLTGCMTRTWSDLPAHVHRAWVCTRMPQVEPDARYWAVHLATNTIVSDADPDDFDEFVPYADIVYIYDSTARAESVHAFPIPYNLLSCDDPNALLPRAVDDGPRLPNGNDNPLRHAKWDPFHTDLEDISPGNARFVGAENRAPKKKGPEIIPVCTHPPDVRADAKEWLFTTEKAGASYTRDPDLYARLRAGARRVYVFDPAAPAESVLRFPSPHNRLRCPGKPLPGDAHPPGADPDYKAAIDARVQALSAKASVSEFGGDGGSDKRTWTSDPEGHGKSLTFFEAVVRQMVIAGAFQAGDTEGALRDPNGSRYGITTGKNIGGPDSLALQLTAGTFMLLKNPLRSTGAFIRKVASAARRKGVLIITNPKLMPKKLAEQLVEKFGDDMAPSLHQVKTILPYSRASMFTQGWRYLYQAHHILEVDMAKNVLKLSNFDDIPAIILKDAEHKAITKEIEAARQAWLKRHPGKNIDPKGLWEIYQSAYINCPEYLKAIEAYFQ